MPALNDAEDMRLIIQQRLASSPLPALRHVASTWASHLLAFVQWYAGDAIVSTKKVDQKASKNNETENLELK